MSLRTITFAAVALAFGASAFAASLPNFDALADAPRVDLESAWKTVSALGTQACGVRVQWNDRFAVPSFVWAANARPGIVAAKVAQSSESVAREYVASYAPLYGLDSADIGVAYVSAIHDTGRGAIVVKLKQRIGDVEVFREELNVVMDRDRELIALSGHISAVPRTSRLVASSVAAPAFLLSPGAAIAAAYFDATSHERPIDVNELQPRGSDAAGFQLYEREGSASIRAKRVYFHLPDRHEPAYYLEVPVAGGEQTSDDLYSYVISAVDGRLLFRNNLTVDQTAPAAFTYRVWAGSDDHLPFAGPQGYDGTPNPTAAADGYQPAFVAPNLVSLAYGPISTKDPWLADTATETSGNNVDAYADVNSPDGLSGNDFRATANGALAFDRTYDVTKAPAASDAQRMAAITQLFYNINYLHDWFYDSGFNEAAGNAQVNNFGRGGVGGDPIRGEAQDFGGRNNANMQTPSDGRRPRMQMYTWDGLGSRDLSVDPPSAIARSYATGYAQFGPQTFDLTGEVVAMNPADGCYPTTTNLAGKIVFIDRGGVNCTFSLKMMNAKQAGAVGVIVGNVASSDNPESIVTMACNGSCSPLEMAYPPALLVALTDANAFRSQLASGLRVTMRRAGSIDRDGTIDNQIVAHEWGHYFSNRLIANANGLTSTQSRGMGEGWSDFIALLLTTRATDTRFASNADFGGVYAAAIYVMSGGSNGPQLNNGTYFGIRRVPYSTDMTKDPLTLKHISNGVAIAGAPLRYGQSGSNNAEVHNTGEVWASMLWEAYASLLRDTFGSNPRLSFGQAQQRMKDYLVASLKITPPDPTFLEARDAVLAAAFARDIVDYQRFWQAFAKRGAGITAVAADRYSVVNAGVAEDFNAGGALTVTAVTIDDNVKSCVRNGTLDAGESGVIRISLKNTGAVRMQATTISAASSDSSLAFDTGGRTAIVASNPGDTVTATIPVTLSSSAASIVKPDITFTIEDPQMTAAGGMKSLYEARLNASDGPKQTATDDFESATSAWTVNASGAAEWKRREVTARDHRWFAAEPASRADTSLMSPQLMVTSSGDFKMTFRHRFAFDYFTDTSGNLQYIDGGVLEISADNGGTWTDIGSKIDGSTVGYGSRGILGGNGSAIEGRRSFQGTTPGYSNVTPSAAPFVTTTVNLGTEYAGKRVRVRFRSVTAEDHTSTPRLGWEIDDVEFTGIANLPFSLLIADSGVCSVSSSSTALTSSATTVQSGSPVTLTAAVSSATSPVGTVDFLDHGAILATVPVANGTAKLTTSLPNGTHGIRAVFNGGKNVTSSTTSLVKVQVGPVTGKWLGRAVQNP